MLYRDSSHTYTNAEGEVYKSVTTLLGELENKKDWNSIAAGYLNKHLKNGTLLEDLAKKNKISLQKAKELWGNDEYTVEWVLNLWRRNNTKSTDGGSNFHIFMENEKAKNPNTVYNPVVNDVKEFPEVKSLKPGKTYLELGLGSHLHKVWGQADRVIINGDKTFDIRDWKTNKNRSKLDNVPQKEFNPSTRKMKISFFNPPVSSLHCNKYNTYALQLSMYAYFLEINGFKCNRLFIDYVHTKFISIDDQVLEEDVLHRDMEFGRIRVIDRSKGVNGLEEIEVPYLKKQVKNILKLRQAKLYSHGIP